MIRRQFYGWYDLRRREFRLSLAPPDAPVRPSLGFPTKVDVVEYAQRKRGTIMWWPPLTLQQEKIGEEVRP